MEIPGLGPLVPETDPFQPYEVNLLVDNRGQKSPPIVIEDYPTYRNLFGSIERIVDRKGVWRTDFSRIKAGSLMKALLQCLQHPVPAEGGILQAA